MSITPSICRLITLPKSLVDVGCGTGGFINSSRRWGNYSKVRKAYKIGLDIYDPFLRDAKRIYDEVIKCDVKCIPLRNTIIDVVICSQVIEHLEKEGGLRLLNELERICCNEIMLTTHVGHYAKLCPEDDNPFQAHRSVWYPFEFIAKGYLVRGFHGARFPYVKKSSYPYFKVRWLIRVFCVITEFLAYFFPSAAYQMLCVMDVKKRKSQIS